VLKTRTVAGSKLGGMRNSSSTMGLSSMRTGMPPRSEPSLSNHLGGDRQAVRQMKTQDQRVERAAHVVDVGHHQRLASALDEAFEEAAAFERVGQVTVAGSVLAGPVCRRPRRCCLRA